MTPSQEPRAPGSPPSPWLRKQAGRLAEMLTEQIRKGVAPWQKPWAPGEHAMPHNVVSEREYSGFNAIALAVTAEWCGYGDTRWGTYRQIRMAGGQVRKGEKGAGIVVLKRYGRKLLTDEAGKPVLSPEGRKTYKAFPLRHHFIRGYTVFNAEQADDLPPVERAARTLDWSPVQEAERLLRESGVEIVHVAGDRAFYAPARDRITLPQREQFDTPTAYYQTALHELGHATGHASRLDRKLATPSDTAGYAREELRAEMCAMLTGTRIGIGHDPSRGAAYVDSWVQQLQEHPMEIHAAAVEAGRMSEYIIGLGRDRAQEKAARPGPARRRDEEYDRGR